MHRLDSSDGHSRQPPQTQGVPNASAELHAARSQSDADLLRRLDEGDPQAFDVIYRRYLPYLFDYVSKQFPSLDKQAAEDISNETMLRAWRHRDRVGAVDSLLPYLITVAKNFILRGFRARRPKEVELSPNIGARGPSPSEAVEWEELARQIPEALESLPESQRRALELRWQGHSHNEISVRLGCTPNAARILVQKGNKKLGRAISHCGDSCAIDAAHPEECPARKGNLYCHKCHSRRGL